MPVTYVVAVSGGVDSMVLLHKIAANRVPNTNQPTKTQDSPVFIVAHFDHGARPDSRLDAALVEEAAHAYGFEYESERAELGSDVSESRARAARYAFLFRVKEVYGAEAVVTAHHQDDVLETMILNIWRGTGPRGLIGYTRLGVVRPLLHLPKSVLLGYARRHGVRWREDSTNSSIKYLRNNIRCNYMPQLSVAQRAQLLGIRRRIQNILADSDHRTTLLIRAISSDVDGDRIVRARFVVLSFTVQKQIIAALLSRQSVELTIQKVVTLTLSAKTLSPGHCVDVDRSVVLRSGKKDFWFTHSGLRR